MSEAYHPVSFLNKKYKRQDYLENHNQKYSEFDSMNSIFYKKMPSAYSESAPITSKKGQFNRNYIDSVKMAMQDQKNSNDYTTQNKHDYNSNNYAIPKPPFTSQDMILKRNQKIVFGTDDVREDQQFSEKQKQYRLYNRDEFQKKNDGSIFKLRNDSNPRAHHHDFDFFGFNKNQKPISNYNQNYLDLHKERALANPFIHHERQKTIEKMKQDHIQLGDYTRNPLDNKSEAMRAYANDHPHSVPSKSVYQQMLNQRYNMPLVLGTDQVIYDTTSKLSTSQVVNNSELSQQQQSLKDSKLVNGIASRKTNFEMGNNGFEEYRRNMEGANLQQEYINQYKYNKEIYQKRLMENRIDNTILGEDKNNYSSVAKSELPHHPTNIYQEAKAQLQKQSNEQNQLEDKEIFGTDFNKGYYQSEKQDQYKNYGNVKPNKLSPIQESSLRYSSIKFDDLKNPEFVSIKQSSFLSPNLVKKDPSSLQKKLEESIKRVPNEEFIFIDKNNPKWQTTNQVLLQTPKETKPNSLGDKLYDLKMSHFELR